MIHIFGFTRRRNHAIVPNPGVFVDDGAANAAVRGVVVVEGVVVGLLSGVIGVLLALPIGFLLSAAVIKAVLKADVNYQFSLFGVLVWLGVIVLIGVFSSLSPARNAVNLSVREVLDYE